MDKKKDLQKQYNVDSKKKEYKNVVNKQIKEKIWNIIDIVVGNLEYDKAALELTPFEAAFFTFKIADDKKIYLDYRWKGNTVFISYWKNGKNIFNYFIDKEELSNFIQELKVWVK
jgi:hypothetical protein